MWNYSRWPVYAVAMWQGPVVAGPMTQLSGLKRLCSDDKTELAKRMHDMLQPQLPLEK